MVRFLVLDRRGGSPDLIQLYKGEHEVHTYTEFPMALDFVHRESGYNVGLHYLFTRVKQVRSNAALEGFDNTISHILKVRKDWKRQWGQVPLEVIVLPQEKSLYGGSDRTFQRDFQLAQQYLKYVKKHRLTGVLFTDVLAFETNLELGLKLWSNYFRWKNEAGRKLSADYVMRLTRRSR